MPTTPRDDIARTIRAIIAEAAERPLAEVQDSSRFGADLGMDSMAMIDTQVRIEERLGVRMPDLDDLLEQNVERVGELVDLVSATVEREAS